MHPTLERLRGTVGIWTSTHEGLGASELAAMTASLESAGYSAIWTPEAYGRESMTGAQLLLDRSSTLVVASGIASIYARDAMATASASRTLSAASAQRFVLGLGVSHRPLVERVRRGSYLAPIAAMTQYLDEMDSAAVLSVEHDEVVPRVLAALGPRMLELAATRTDGAHTYLVTPEHTGTARAALKGGFLGVEQAVVLDEDRDEFLRRAHEYLNVYTGLDNYRANWRRLGFGDEDFVRGGSERLCDAFVVHGDEAKIARGVRDHFDAGADHVCIQVLGTSLVDVPSQDWARLGPALRS